MIRVLIKGAGDIATGIACRLHHAGFQIIMTEIAQPTTIRKSVAFSQAIYDGETIVENIKAVFVKNIEEIEDVLSQRQVAVVVDPTLKCLADYKTDILVDAVLAKYNTGTRKEDAKLVVGVGPGFYAGQDCHVIIESKRGHFLGRLIYEGAAIPNSGVPGKIEGFGRERLIRASADGIYYPACKLGDFVKRGDIVAYCDTSPVFAELDGMVRGMLQEGLSVKRGMKCGDVDPRCDTQLVDTVSDKARAIGGGVLEAICAYLHRQKEAAFF